MLYIFVFGPAVLTYVFLVCLPSRLPALAGCFLASCILMLVSIGTDLGDDAYIGPILFFIAGAVVFAAFVQTSRVYFALDQTKWVYPSIAVIVLVGIALPIALFSGV